MGEGYLGVLAAVHIGKGQKICPRLAIFAFLCAKVGGAEPLEG